MAGVVESESRAEFRQFLPPSSAEGIVSAEIANHGAHTTKKGRLKGPPKGSGTGPTNAKSMAGVAKPRISELPDPDPTLDPTLIRPWIRP